MSSTKTKLLESAQKNFLKGHYDRAVFDYRQLIQLEPSDLRHRQKIAEILTKANQKDEAIKEYSSLAKIYIDSIHYLKAIAVYKQIQKIDPTNPDISLTLASLNEKQGLIGNATAEYATAVQIYEKNGENLKALRALESMISIDSSNSAVKLRLAEKYFSTGSEDKSFDIFVSTLKDLKERDDENGFALISQRAINIFGNRAETFITDLESTASAIDGEVDPIQSVSTIPIACETVQYEHPAKDTTPLPPLDVFPAEFSNSTTSVEDDYIEDILPLEDDEIFDIDPAEPCEEWEEDIDLNFLESDAISTDVTALSSYTSEAGLDDLELELEIEDIPAIETTATQKNDFDLSEDLSVFADEIDFNLFGEDKSVLSFDSTSHGFKKSDLTNEDTESHYSLGLAYKEMGLFDEAISEFIFSSRSPDRRIDSMILQGVCLREIGNIGKAIEMLADIIKETEITEDELLGLQYELAVCHEISGDTSLASELYSEIVKTRPNFSDTSIRLKKLSL